MGGWKTVVSRWLGRGRADPPAGDAGTSATQAPKPARTALAAVPGPQAPEPDADLELRHFRWLCGIEVALEAPLSATETRRLQELDAVLAGKSLRGDLVPRAQAVIPQLLHSLRNETQSLQERAARVARDPNLVVEVLHLANSVAHRGGEPAGDLLQALSRLGTDGLRRAVARVLLKPILDDRSSPLLARTAARLWQQAELQAQLCQQQAAAARLDAGEAYLAGLMHNVGWTASLRLFDLGREGAAPALAEPVSGAFVQALPARRGRLFARLLQSWHISAGLDAAAEGILSQEWGRAESGLARVLHDSDREACRRVLAQPC